MKLLSNKEYKEILDKKSGKVVIDFFAEWCGPCQMLAPVMEEVSKEYPDVEFYKVNIDEEQELAIENSVFSIPTIVFLKDGQEAKRAVGFLSKQEFKEYIENL